MNPLRTIALEIVNDAHNLGMKYVKHQTLASFFNKFFKPRLDRIILYEASDEDLKTVMWSMKKKMDKAIKLFDTAELIDEGEKLGSPKIANVGDISKAMQLLQDLKL